MIFAPHISPTLCPYCCGVWRSGLRRAVASRQRSRDAEQVVNLLLTALFSVRYIEFWHVQSVRSRVYVIL